MKQYTARLIALFTLTALCATTLSCGGDAGGTGVESTTELTEATVTSTEPPIETSAVPEGLDFEGKKFMLLGGDSVFSHYTMATEANGDSMNDSLFERYSRVSEQLNVEFDFLQENASGAVSKITNSVLAGDDAYQLAIVQRATGIAAMVEDRVLYDWNDLPYIDLDGKYWYQSATDSLRIGDSVYYTYGDIYPLSAHVFYYNKTIATDYKLENPHQLVINGKWTLDKMIEMSTQVSKDLNGDNVMDELDQYGISFTNTDTINSLMFGCGLSITENTGTDVKLRSYTDKTVDIFNKIYKLTNTDDTAYVRTLNQIKFVSGQLLFCTGTVHGARNYRDSEVDFGLLPYPKYNEAQENYISFLNTELMCVPSTADKEMAGAVIQLLAEESGDVKTAYYEYLLKGKVARDEESEIVLDLIFENAVGEFLVSFCGASSNCKQMYTIPSRLVMNGQTDFVSEFDSIADAVREEIKQVCDMIRESEK